MKPLRNSDGLHYNIFQYQEYESMEMLREVFPDAETNELNFCLFSTSGVHGTYATIENAENDLSSGEGVAKVTFLVVHPRVVALRYGNVLIENKEDIAFLKKLRANSLDSIKLIGGDAE